ncbi:YcgL domain-containing protein [Alteromonas sp. H39]|uniref:YcgL domain-containing protein n=1 Tax=Alteromonas sp. H39 TaxID=3389876 RepID=UPI0039E1679C
MLCAVYKTKKKSGMFLYVPKKDDFDEVPDALMKQFGHPELVMMLPLDKREHLGSVEKQKLIAALTEQGYYLQMPPKEENLLESHRVAMGLPARPDDKKNG